jgi:hypothetical protein
MFWVALACAVCSTGDPTLTVAGTEQPFAGRLRSALELQYQTHDAGRAGVDQLHISEARADVSLAWAPDPRWLFAARLPLLDRQIQDVSLGVRETWGIGELELDAKWFVWTDREFAPRWLIAWLGGVQLPTAPLHRDAAGEILPLVAQPGAGAWGLGLGPSLSAVAGDSSGYASLRWTQPLLTPGPFEPGASLGASLAVQEQLATWLAARAVSELRADRQSREQGRRDPDSGGAIAFVGGDAVWSPLPDLVAQLGARVPAFTRLRGAQREGPAFRFALVRDW